MTRANMPMDTCGLKDEAAAAGSFGGRLRAAGALAMRVLTWPTRFVEARAVMNRLGAMSDPELRDIGLTRQDLRDATALVPDEDPTRLLAGRAASRTRFIR